MVGCPQSFRTALKCLLGLYMHMEDGGTKSIMMGHYDSVAGDERVLMNVKSLTKTQTKYRIRQTGKVIHVLHPDKYNKRIIQDKINCIAKCRKKTCFQEKLTLFCYTCVRKRVKSHQSMGRECNGHGSSFLGQLPPGSNN